MKYKAILVISLLMGAMLPAAKGQEVVTDSLSLDKGMALSPASLIQGRVAGVRVSSYDGSTNGAMSTLIRGVNVLRGDSQPLWIVDGVMINSALTRNNKAFWQYGEQSYTSARNVLSFINPYDIESIEVIKDLSAAAIYGSRGANGVIIINTGRKSAEGFNIDVRSNVGLNSSAEELSGDRLGLSHNHYVNLTGTVGNTAYTVAASLRHTEGIFAGDDADYGGLRVAFHTNAGKHLNFGLNSILTMGKANSITATSYFGQPSLTLSLKDMSTFRTDKAAGWKSDYDDESVERRFTTSMYVNVTLLDGLTWENAGGVDFLNDNRYIWYGNGTSFGLANNGAASVLGTTLMKYNASSKLAFDKHFSAHHIVAKVAVEASGDWEKNSIINGTDFFSHVLRARGVRLGGSEVRPYNYNYNYDTWGMYAGLAYSVKDTWGWDILYRRDNTPRYDDSHFRTYRAGDMFFDLHNAFFPQGKAFSSLRVSAGYGEAGREQMVPYNLYGDYLSGSYTVPAAGLEPLYEGLNRVESRELNIGADLGLFSDRFKLHVAYYDKKSDDRFLGYYFGKLSDKIHYVSGDRQDDFSVCSRIANRGFEGDLVLSLVDSDNWKWTVRANGAYNVNQVLRLDEADLFGRSVGSGVVVNANALGYSVGSLYGYSVDRSASYNYLHYVDETKDGRIDEFDEGIIGNPIPKWVYGLGTTVQVGRFTLDILADGAADFDLFNFNSLVKSDLYPYHPSSVFVESADYFRLSRVSLGYDFDIPGLKWLKGLSVNASAYNLLTVSPYSGWNPTVNSFATSYLSNGVDYGSYPIMRSFVLGVNLNF